MELLSLLYPVVQHVFHDDTIVVKLLSEVLRRQEEVLALFRAHLDRIFATCLPSQNFFDAQHFTLLEDREHNLFRFVSSELVHNTQVVIVSTSIIIGVCLKIFS